MMDASWIINSGVYKLKYDNIGKLINVPVQKIEYKPDWTD